ncbi:MAG TPA: alcohol dehydrogenase, partial [Cytophagales bacterium]|nr:alcohol dehydrogenase [Cytophagales bacterium]
MKALVYHRYGGPEQLQVAEVPKPQPRKGEILVRVRACGLNSWDWDMLRGRPAFMRMAHWRRPQFPILGADVAGEVVALGEGVSGWQPGDRVLADLSADHWGGLAEFATGKAESWARLPEGLSFEAAAAEPQAGTPALP